MEKGLYEHKHASRDDDLFSTLSMVVVELLALLVTPFSK